METEMKNVKFQQSPVRICFLAGSLPVNVSCLHNLVKKHVFCFKLWNNVIICGLSHFGREVGVCSALCCWF